MTEPFLQIGPRRISLDQPSYFIADIASNHDGKLERARRLLELAADAGADAVKFQHFLAKDIVSDAGFRSLGGQVSHQASWRKPVFEVYEQYELDRAWTEELAQLADEAGVDFMSTPYDLAAVEQLRPLVPAWKIGSGDITWTGMIEAVCASGKPVLIATGAASLDDVRRAAGVPRKHGVPYALLQCNTNYTGEMENFSFINLNALKAFAEHWPEAVLGLSDHTPGHVTVLGAVALGARVIEKHFTDDNSRQGPDHAFSMDPSSWRQMVESTRELEAALGDGVKRIEANETETVVVQRRSLCASEQLKAGATLSAAVVKPLRPAPKGSYEPYRLSELDGAVLEDDLQPGDPILAHNLRDHA